MESFNSINLEFRKELLEASDNNPRIHKNTIDILIKHDIKTIERNLDKLDTEDAKKDYIRTLLESINKNKEFFVLESPLYYYLIISKYF